MCLVPQRDPIHTAKEVATVDVLSGGRVIFGVGAGWNRQEMRNHGTDPRTRMRLLTERVQAMIEIWTNDVAEYHGQLVDFDPLQAWPKPVQTPYPPIMVGGAGPTVEDRVLAFGDGWAPMIGGIEDQVFDRFARLQDRTDKPLELTASGPTPDRATLARLRDRGAHRALVWLPQDAAGAISDSDTERFLDDLARSHPWPIGDARHDAALGSAAAEGSLSVAPSSGTPTRAPTRGSVAVHHEQGPSCV